MKKCFNFDEKTRKSIQNAFSLTDRSIYEVIELSVDNFVFFASVEAKLQNSSKNLLTVCKVY